MIKNRILDKTEFGNFSKFIRISICCQYQSLLKLFVSWNYWTNLIIYPFIMLIYLHYLDSWIICWFSRMCEICICNIYGFYFKKMSVFNAWKIKKNVTFAFYFPEPTGTVTFHRQSFRTANLPKWHISTRGIRTAVIKSSGLIETDGQGMLQVK